MADELKQISDLIHEVKSNHEAFKKANDEKLALLEKKGSADGLLTEKIERLSKAIDDSEVKRGKLETELKARSDALEAAMKRTMSSEHETKTELQDGTVVETKANDLARKSYSDFLRKGRGAEIESGRQGWTPSEDEVKAMAVRADPDGGFLVTADMSGRIVKHVFETSPLRQVANVVTISTDALEGMFDLDELNAGWVAEQDSRPNTGTPKLGKYRIQVHELYANPAVTQSLLDDASIDIEAYLAGKVADKLSRVENAAFISGTGKGQPQGFLNYAAGVNWSNDTKQIEQVTSAASAVFDFDSLIDIQYRLKQPYRDRAKWAFARLSFPAIRKLKDNYGRYLWEPSTQIGAPSTLLGAGIVELNDFPAIAASALVAAYADWNEAYQIVDRIGVRILRDPFTAKPNVSFYTTKRVGGDVINGEAMKIYKLHA
jgi:HK97 family phage major capsid protein